MAGGLHFTTLEGEHSLAEKLAGLSEGDLTTALADFKESELQDLFYDWEFWARPNQKPPRGDWFCWLVLAGRGFGKTRMGAEWVKSHVLGSTPLKAAKSEFSRVALLAQTHHDGREVMVEGESGLLRVCPPGFKPKFEVTRRRLVWPNGVIASLYSAEEPDQLRGPQHHLAWGDELAKWRNQELAWANLLLGLRLGKAPRVMVTTTPKPGDLLRALVKDPKVAVTRGRTKDNRVHLSGDFLYHINRLYDGTRLGRQELEGELLEDIEGALWKRDVIDKTRTREFPPLNRIVVAVDPPVSHGENADKCGIVVAGKCADGHVYVLADKTEGKLTPHGWGTKALRAYDHFEADRLVAEVNNGGDLVEALIRQLQPNVSYRKVHASRGKIARAEPVAVLYERGLVHHVGVFRELEDELCCYTGEPGQKSPDRMDALVWAITDLVLKGGGPPRIRAL